MKKNLINNKKNGIQTGPPGWMQAKPLWAVLALIAGLQCSYAGVVQSPHGAEVFGSASVAIVVPPPVKKVRLTWNFPVARQTSDLIFKVYHSTDLSVSIRQWALLTNISGNLRSVDLPAASARGYFVLTASNYLGESKYATR